MTPAAGVISQIVPADARRWYLRISPVGGGGAGALGPLPLPAGATAFPQTSVAFELKWKDAPSLVAGPWGGTGAAGLSYHVWESLYVGEG